MIRKTNPFDDGLGDLNINWYTTWYHEIQCELFLHLRSFVLSIWMYFQTHLAGPGFLFFPLTMPFERPNHYTAFMLQLASAGSPARSRLPALFPPAPEQGRFSHWIAQVDCDFMSAVNVSGAVRFFPRDAVA